MRSRFVTIVREWVATPPTDEGGLLVGTSTLARALGPTRLHSLSACVYLLGSSTPKSSEVAHTRVDWPGIGAYSGLANPATRGGRSHLNSETLALLGPRPSPSDHFAKASLTQESSRTPTRRKSKQCLGRQAGMPDSSALSSLEIVMRRRSRPEYSPFRFPDWKRWTAGSIARCHWSRGLGIGGSTGGAGA